MSRDRKTNHSTFIILLPLLSQTLSPSLFTVIMKSRVSEGNNEGGCGRLTETTKHRTVAFITPTKDHQKLIPPPAAKHLPLTAGVHLGNKDQAAGLCSILFIWNNSFLKVTAPIQLPRIQGEKARQTGSHTPLVFYFFSVPRSWT